MRRYAIFACLLLFGVGMLWAQSDRATITGEVHDSTGAVVPGVKVQVINTATNDVINLTTNESGRYVAPNLVIGGYKLIFVKDGFKKVVRKDITLGVGQSASVNVALEAGGSEVTVEVTGALPMLQTEDAKLTTNLDNKTVTDLPLNVKGGRSLASFIFAFVPGVEGSDYDSHINGSMAKSKEVMIDGTSAVSQLGGYISETQPPMEGVAEFQVETSGISADAGRTGGGVIRYEMKSGTNDWHGSLFGFMHDKSLNALSANNKLNMQKDPAHAYLYDKPKEVLSDWGGSFGGPILKNKLFTYTAFERYMESNWSAGGMGSQVPTDAFLNGDLSSLLNKSVQLGVDQAGNPIYQGAIFDPTTGNVFVNNQIDPSRFSTVSQKILAIYKKYYQPASSNIQNNAMPATSPGWYHVTQTSEKVDYVVNDKHRINGSFIYNFYPRILDDQGGIWSYTAPYGGPLANAYKHNTKSPSVRLSDSYMLTPTLLNSARFTLNRFYNPSIAASQSGAWDKALGLGNFGAGNFPKITFGCSNYTAVCMSNIGSQFNDFYAANTYIYNDDVTWTHGRHTLKFGGEFRAMQFNSHADNGVLNMSFDAAQTGAPNASYANNVGSSWASFLLGLANSGSVSQVNNTYGRRKAVSLYASDNIKVNRKLTLNVDLRWDMNTRYKEKNGHWSTFDTSLTNPTTGLPGALRFLSNGDQSFEKYQDYLNFAPHVGAAYQLDNKTVVRGSFSIFYVPLNMNTWGALPYSFNPGYGKTNEIQTPSATTGSGQRVAAFNLNNGYTAPTTNDTLNPNYTKWGMVSIDPHSLTPGNTQQWMVGVQRELTKDTKVDISYVQSYSYHLQSGVLAGNQPKISDLQALIKRGTQYAWVSDAASASAAGVPYPYAGFAGQAWMAITPYPSVAASWGPLFYVGTPKGNSSYKGLQISVTKRAAHGLSVQGSYVYSRTRGDVDTSFQELWGTGSIQNLYDLKSERNAIASFDMTHVVKGYVQYELPMGRGKWLFNGADSFLDKVVSNWQLSLGFHYNSGTPLSLHSSNSYPGLNSVYVNIAPGCSLTNGSRSLGKQWLNRSCFLNPDASTGALGTAGNFLEDVRNPGLSSEDLSLSKGVSWGSNQRYRMSFRFDFFNVFNRHQDGGPVTNMTDPNFGKIINYGGQGGRVGQFGARFTF